MPETKVVKLQPAFGKARQINIIKRDLFISKEVRDNLDKAVPRMKYITPTELANKFGLKISTVKEYLKELEKKHVIARADVSNPKLWVFVPTKTK